MTLARKLCDIVGSLGGDHYAGLIARGNLESLLACPQALTAQLRKSQRVVRRNNRIVETHALEALHDVMQLAHGLGIKPFLFFGTLLGFVRDQGFIPGDSDIDLGVVDCQCLKKLCTGAQKQGFGRDKIRWHKGRLSSLALKHPNGSVVDLKDCQTGPDNSTTWITFSATLAVKKQFPAAMDLQEVSFKSTPVFIPVCAAEYLEWQYGTDWRMPDPDYHYVTSGPLHGEEHVQFVANAGPIAILHMLQSGRLSKAAGMTDSMAALFPEDTLWPRLARLVASVES